MAQGWKKWFEGYASDWRNGELQQVADRYAPLFQAIKPGKNASYRNGEGFVSWLGAVRQFHIDAGLSSVEIVTTHVSNLGDQFTLASVLWAVRFERRSTVRIQFEISYLLADSGDESPRILSVISHQDQREAMRKYNVLPPWLAAQQG